MELYTQNMFFRGNTEKEKAFDCCIHGEIIFKIHDKLLSDNTVWCVSASAYRFLQTLFENHFIGNEEFLIPCCGHTMIPNNDKTSVSIIGCNNGIDFNIIHKEESVVIITTDNQEYQVPFADYKSGILAFAEQIIDFYKSNTPRAFKNDFDKECFSAFVTEFYSRYNKGFSLGDDVPAIERITLENYDVYTENEIAGISKEGISLTDLDFINFKECVYNFNQIYGGSGKCIGERNITEFSFTFYTSPKPIIIKFIQKNRFKFVTKNNTISRFHSLQKQIEGYGYSTRDMS